MLYLHLSHLLHGFALAFLILKLPHDPFADASLHVLPWRVCVAVTSLHSYVAGTPSNPLRHHIRYLLKGQQFLLLCEERLLAS